MQQVRWGVIGAGGFGDRVGIPGILGSKRSTLQAVMVRDRDRAEALSRKHGAPESYDSAEALIASPNVDAVYLCTPVHLHAPHTILAAQHGKHVCCEKPMALDVPECQGMIDACARAGVKLMPAFMSRFHPHHRHIRDLVRAGALGRVVQARAQCAFWYASRPGLWRQDPKTGGGGGLWDVGAHAVDMLRFLIGKVTSVCAVVDTLVHDYPVDDVSVCLLRFENGSVGIADASFAISCNRGLLEVYGTEGALIGEDTISQKAQPRARLLRRGGPTEEIVVTGPDRYALQFEHFARCVLEDQEPEVTGHDGLVNIQILRAAEASSRTGNRIEIA